MTEEYDPERSLLSIDWEMDRPTDAELAAARKRTRFEVPEEDVVPEVARDLERIMDDIHVNGGAALGAVRLPPDEILDWYLSRNRAGWLQRDVLAALALREAMPALDLPADRDPETYADIEWRTRPSYTLDGYLAQRLVSGGAYYDFLDPPYSDVEREVPGYEHVPDSYGDRRDAKRFGERFVDAVFDERYGEFRVDVTYDQWCDWFPGVPAWDITYMWFDRRTRLAWVFAVTGAD